MIKCNVTTTTVSSITRAQDGTSAHDHSIGASVGYMFVPSHYTNLITEVSGSVSGGWQDPAETWTYNDDDTIDVPAGALTKYSKGDKVKYSQSIPLQNYWPFQSNVDSIAAIAMTNIGTPTYTAGEFSNALTLNGTDQALQVGSDTTASNLTMKLGNTGTAFTIGAWVKTTIKNKVIFQSYSDNTNSNGVFLYIDTSTGFPTLWVGNNSASPSTVIAGTTDVTTGGASGWHYIVVTFQNNFAKIYVNGVLSASGYAVNPTYATTSYVRIGCACVAGSNADFFNGQIDDLFIINGFALDDQYIAAKYALTTAQGTSNITATQYHYITAVADTALTINGGADYVPYNATISSPYYSKASTPLNFPQWFNYTPTWGGFSAVPTVKAKFTINGQTCLFKARTVTNGTSNATTFTMTLPVVPIIPTGAILLFESLYTYDDVGGAGGIYMTHGNVTSGNTVNFYRLTGTFPILTPDQAYSSSNSKGLALESTFNYEI